MPATDDRQMMRPPSRSTPREQRLGDAHDGAEVDVRAPRPTARGFMLRERLVARDAGVVHDDVDAAERS